MATPTVEQLQLGCMQERRRESEVEGGVNVSKGDLAWIIKSVDNVNAGKIVRVVEYRGEHSKYGPIWRVESEGSDLVSEYGGCGRFVDCADDWLKRIPPENPGGVGEAAHRPIAEVV